MLIFTRRSVVCALLDIFSDTMNPHAPLCECVFHGISSVVDKVKTGVGWTDMFLHIEVKSM